MSECIDMRDIVVIDVRSSSSAMLFEAMIMILILLA